jgi:MerR family mercuric resistance operon transcriptional regulator
MFTGRHGKVCRDYRLKRFAGGMGDHGSEKGLNRAGLARRTGCNLETIRYYETIGMMPDPPRTASGYRVYDETHVARLRFILRGRELGFSIEDLRALLRLVDRGAQTCAEFKATTEQHLAHVRAKIADLRRIETVLAATAARCSGDEVPECPVLDALAS